MNSSSQKQDNSYFNGIEEASQRQMMRGADQFNSYGDSGDMFRNSKLNGDSWSNLNEEQPEMQPNAPIKFKVISGIVNPGNKNLELSKYKNRSASMLAQEQLNGEQDNIIKHQALLDAVHQQQRVNPGIGLNPGSNSGTANGGPTISVINYNNPTINMNFNEAKKSKPSSNFLTSPTGVGGKMNFEDNDFYESLNYSKFGSHLPQQLQQPKHQQAGPPMPAAIHTFYSQTVQQTNSSLQANHQSTVMKTIPIPAIHPSPYDNLESQSKHGRGNQSFNVLSDQEEEGDTLDGVEEIAQEVTSKKKIVKKKIIKKIIKRKNPDGTDAPPEVHTIIVERESTSTQKSSAPTESAPGSRQEITHSQVEQLQEQPSEVYNNENGISPPKKKIIKKVIVKKKKRNEDGSLVEVTQASTTMQSQAILEGGMKALEHETINQRTMGTVQQPVFNPNQTVNITAQNQQQPVQQTKPKVKQPALTAVTSQKALQEVSPSKLKRSAVKEDPEIPEDTGVVAQLTRRDDEIAEKRKLRRPVQDRPSSAMRIKDDEVKDNVQEGRNKRRLPSQIQQRSQSVMGGVEKASQNTRGGHQSKQKQNEEDEEEEEGTEDDGEDRNEVEDSAEDEEAEEEKGGNDSHRNKIKKLQRQQKEFMKQQQIIQQQQQQLMAQQKMLENQKNGVGKGNGEGASQDQQQHQQQQQMSQQQQQQRVAMNQPIIQKPISFKVAVCDSESYKAFVDQIVFGSRAKELLMNPIPFQLGQLRFTISRHRSGLNRLHPSYYIFLEKNTGGRVLMLYAKKRAFNKTANYLISMEKNKTDRDNDICIGKLRANPEGDKYVLYDSGENYTKVHQYPLDKIRNEHGVFIYRYEPCNVGNIRKMIVLLPTLVMSPIPQGTAVDNTLPLGQDQQGNFVLMTQKPWKPIREQDTLSEVFSREAIRNQNYQVFVDNPPAWNPKTNTYVYDFKGRVTQPSIKNFQLIPELDGRRQVTLQDFVLQFGKNGKESFILDVQYPFSIFQAFGLGLSAFDTD